jgi:hypothetical protein
MLKTETDVEKDDFDTSTGILSGIFEISRLENRKPLATVFLKPRQMLRRHGVAPLFSTSLMEDALFKAARICLKKATTSSLFSSVWDDATRFNLIVLFSSSWILSPSFSGTALAHLTIIGRHPGDSRSNTSRPFARR